LITLNHCRPDTADYNKAIIILFKEYSIMKQAFLLFAAVITLAGTVWFNAGAASSDTQKVSFIADAFMDAQAGQSLNANLYADSGNTQRISCEATAQPGMLTCNIPTEYAGQELSLQFKRDGILYVYLVDVPAQ
jgi:hypothetical protein